MAPNNKTRAKCPPRPTRTDLEPWRVVSPRTKTARDYSKSEVTPRDASLTQPQKMSINLRQSRGRATRRLRRLRGAPVFERSRILCAKKKRPSSLGTIWKGVSTRERGGTRSRKTNAKDQDLVWKTPRTCYDSARDPIRISSTETRGASRGVVARGSLAPLDARRAAKKNAVLGNKADEASHRDAGRRRRRANEASAFRTPMPSALLVEF